MNFFQQQAAARRRSSLLVALFVIAVLAIVTAVDLVVLALSRAHAPLPQTTLPWPLLIGTTVAVLAVISLASVYRVATLAGGGGTVARELGATEIPAQTADPDLQRLRNVVEEVAIASGVPVPRLFVLEHESGINAFAAGFSPADAVVTVTRGALDKLSRDELQGVVAHEFSHVLNGDMRLNIRLMGLLFGILVLAVIGQKILIFGPRGGSRDDRGGGVLAVALALLVFGYIGVFFGRLIKAAVSRSRESLADASAVQFTRQTSGLAGALKKIMAVEAGSRLVNSHGEEVSHMLFADGLGFSAMFATHPPLLARIKALEPGFRPEQLREQAGRWNSPDYRPEPSPGPKAPQPAVAAAPALAAGLAASVARPQPQHYEFARRSLDRLPADLLEAARTPTGAADILLGLLLADSDPLRQSQLAQIQADFGAARRSGVETQAASIKHLAPRLRLPLAAVALSGLRRLTPQVLRQLQASVEAMIKADRRVSVFEYALAYLLRLHIREGLRPTSAGSSGRLSLAGAGRAVGTLLSVLAEQGQARAGDAQRAYAAGVGRLSVGAVPAYVAAGDGWVAAMDAALQALDDLVPADKAKLLEAVSATIAADHHVTVPEAELLQVICAGLHCPLPPLPVPGDPG